MPTAGQASASLIPALTAPSSAAMTGSAGTERAAAAKLGSSLEGILQREYAAEGF